MKLKEITEETRRNAIRLYKNKDLTLQEISNITGLSESYLSKFYKECFKTGQLKPRNPEKVDRLTKKRFTMEQLSEIAEDYYVNNLSANKLKAKYGIHPMQIQRVRNIFGLVYGQKPTGRAVEQFDKQGNKINEFKSCLEAERLLGISNVSRCCSGRLKTAGGYIWKFKEIENKND